MLGERATAPDVHGLHAVADAEDRLFEVEGVLEEELVGGFAEGISGGGFGVEGLVPLLGVDVCAAAGKEDGLSAGDEARLFFLAGVEGHADGDATGLFDSGGVLRPGAPGVLVVVGDRLWY